MKKTKNLTRAKLFYRAKITKPPGVVISATKHKKLIFLSWSKANYSEGDKIYLWVNYKGDFHNSGVYHTWKDFVHAYQAFTEKDLIEDIINNY